MSANQFGVSQASPPSAATGRSLRVCRCELSVVYTIKLPISMNTLPADFRPNLVDNSDQNRSPAECVVQGDLQATVFRLALHDGNVYKALLGAMPSAARCGFTGKQWTITITRRFQVHWVSYWTNRTTTSYRSNYALMASVSTFTIIKTQ